MGSTLSAIGIICAIAVFAVRKLNSYPHSRYFAYKATTVLSVIAIILGILMFFYTPKGTLSVSVESADWKDSYTPVIVNINGTTESGENVSDTINATPGSDYKLNDYEAGSYTFTVDNQCLTQGDTVFYVSSIDEACNFSGTENTTVHISVDIDQDATNLLSQQKAAEEERQKAEEERKKQEAEEKAAEEKAKQEAEEKARQQAQAEAEKKAAAEEAAQQQKAEEEAESAASSEAKKEKVVYITNSGSKYHAAGCRYLRKSKIEISLSDAQAQGYEPCSVCNPG